MSHIVLLGDSIFDNAAYVAGGPDVVKQLRNRLPTGWKATLRAVDGSVTSGVERQLGQLGSRQELCVAVRHRRTNRQLDVGIP